MVWKRVLLRLWVWFYINFVFGYNFKILKKISGGKCLNEKLFRDLNYLIWIWVFFVKFMKVFYISNLKL